MHLHRSRPARDVQNIVHEVSVSNSVVFMYIGEYGIVYKGRMTSAVDRTNSQVVAVKTLKGES